MTARLALSEGCGLVDTIELMASGAREGADAVRFGGRVLSVRELIEKAQSAPGVDWRALSSGGPVRHTARSNARECARMFSEGDSLAACWRFGILQSLDDYASTVRRRGLDLGAMVFAREPEPTGSH